MSRQSEVVSKAAAQVVDRHGSAMPLRTSKAKRLTLVRASNATNALAMMAEYLAELELRIEGIRRAVISLEERVQTPRRALSVRAYASYIGVSQRSVWDMISRGKLNTVTATGPKARGRMRLIVLDELADPGCWSKLNGKKQRPGGDAPGL